MLIFGHAGITLGAAVLIAGAVSRKQIVSITENSQIQSSPEITSEHNNDPNIKRSWLTSLGNNIDIRLLFIGAMLPDIVDKPLGQYLFSDTFLTGRIFCHTILFAILITLAGIYLWKSRKKIWLLTLSFGTLTHLVFDEMWLAPKTLLWPFLGFTFKPADFTDWFPNILQAFYSDPTFYIPEYSGILILAWFTLVLIHSKKAIAFIKYGQIS